LCVLCSGILLVKPYEYNQPITREIEYMGKDWRDGDTNMGEELHNRMPQARRRERDSCAETIIKKRESRQQAKREWERETDTAQG